MATATQALPGRTPLVSWSGEFVRSELTMYPGRGAAIARITVAVVLTFILVATFRIPVAAVTLYTVFTVTRESPTAAIRSAITSIGAITVGLSISLLGVFLFIDYPLLHFLFMLGEFFVLFWLVRVMVQFSAAANIGMAVYNTSNIWTLAYPANPHLENTLWLFISMSLGSLVAAVVEIVIVRQNPIDQILTGVNERLQAVVSLLENYTSDTAHESPAERKIMSFAIVGAGRLRRQLRNAENGQDALRRYLAELSTVVALTGRIVDLAANLRLLTVRPSEADCARLRSLVAEIRRISTSLRYRHNPDPLSMPPGEFSREVPLLPQIEKTVALIPQAFFLESAKLGLPASLDQPSPTRFLVADAFSNTDYIRFALKGCLAATICYVFYTAVAWPGISTSVITCLVTALSTLGAAKQKQVLRMAGATFGGILGIFSITFLLPNMDSITAVTLLMACVSAFGAWVATSSPRLSYFGLQTCLAFYITTLQDYAGPTSLAPARDRFIGVLFGLTVMWVVFDNLWPVRSFEQMRKTLASNMRLVAELVVVLDAIGEDRVCAIPKIRDLRDRIAQGFTEVQIHASTLLFEFGRDRATHLLHREHALRWQASLRAAFLIELALLQYRIEIDPRAIPRDVLEAELVMNRRICELLEWMARAAEGRRSVESPPEAVTTLEEFGNALETWFRSLLQTRLSARAHSVLSLARQLVAILDALANDIRDPDRANADRYMRDPVLATSR